jgi:hypothetical protein
MPTVREVIQVNAELAAIYNQMIIRRDSTRPMFKVSMKMINNNASHICIEPSKMPEGLTENRKQEVMMIRDKCLRQNVALAALLANGLIDMDQEINDTMVNKIISETPTESNSILGTPAEYHAMVGNHPTELLNMNSYHKEVNHRLDELYRLARENTPEMPSPSIRGHILERVKKDPSISAIWESHGHVWTMAFLEESLLKLLEQKERVPDMV